jgi:FAD/FMN-containing dehydrogenase
MALTGGIPKLVILAEFTADIPMEALAHAEAALTSVQKLGIKAHITKTEREAEKYWTFRRESFNLLRKHMRGLRTAPFVDDVVVTPDKLPEFLPKMYAILDKYKLLYTIAGHAGDANFHVIPLMDTREANTAETIKKCMDEVFALIKEEGGSITGEHNDGLIRTSYLPFMFGDDIYQLFLKTKDAFDPQGIFNPGKKVRGDIEAALSHLDTRVV